MKYPPKKGESDIAISSEPMLNEALKGAQVIYEMPALSAAAEQIAENQGKTLKRRRDG